MTAICIERRRLVLTLHTPGLRDGMVDVKERRPG